MKKKLVFILFVLVFSFAIVPEVNAQCAMCSINAEQGVKNGNTVSAGLNTGVLYLLAVPYLMAIIVGVVWYKKYRKKNVHLNMKKEPFNLN
ncbi:hypothetical protein EZ449_00230 [Pedobacter frigidisoli]|uniref:Uncharacterized protein n=1 Tax=Pedobacter frigidisoli TaxID=2530455 RepID=A0A4R0PC15_9SPHI|nr:hypothetical protein [Pedobacter frigidisoli]TCD12513.1 hypothetical protein EZ449_00230 [Pedobacter frigidisoli]